jgi:hypothetical protein
MIGTAVEGLVMLHRRQVLGVTDPASPTPIVR